MDKNWTHFKVMIIQEEQIVLIFTSYTNIPTPNAPTAERPVLMIDPFQ